MVYRSRLSHDFYQVFAGKKDMTLYGWKQLAEWSIEHSCMGSKLQSSVLAEWRKLWDAFCTWIVKEYGTLVKKTEA
jgi:adenosine deaminase CECR1